MATLRQESVAMTIDISRVTTLYQSPSTKTTFSSGQSEWRDHHTSDMEKPWSVSQGCCFDMGQVTPEDSNKTDKAQTISLHWCRHQDEANSRHSRAGIITDTTWTNGKTLMYFGSWNGHAAAMDSAACASLITRRSELGGFRLQGC